MANEYTGSVPINMAHDFIPSNNSLSEPRSSEGEGTSRRGAALGGTRTGAVDAPPPLQQGMNGATFQFPTDQFAAMVGVLLSAMRGTGGWDGEMHGEANEAEAGRRDRGRGVHRRTEGRERREEEVRRAGGRTNSTIRRAGSTSAVSIEEVSSSGPRERSEDMFGRGRDRSERMAHGAERGGGHLKAEVEAGDTSRQVRELRKELEQLREGVLKGAVDPTPIWTSPFSAQIMKEISSAVLKEPTFFYDGASDPEEHLGRFEHLALLHRYPDRIKCRLFLTTLIKAARQ